MPPREAKGGSCSADTARWRSGCRDALAISDSALCWPGSSKQRSIVILHAKGAETMGVDQRLVAAGRIAAPLRREVIDSLRADILAGSFTPGSRLVERDLVERYEVSRTVVREALRQLEADGMVTIVAHKGPVVTEVSREDIVALYEVRCALEALAGKLFALRASSAELRELANAVHAMERAVQDGGTHAKLAAMNSFYDVLLRGSSNSVLSASHQTIRTRIQMMRGIAAPRGSQRGFESVAEIQAILAAARARDAERAAEACYAHAAAAAAVALSDFDATEPLDSKSASR